MFARDAYDVPWCTLYLIDTQNSHAWIAGSVGFQGEGGRPPASVAIPDRIELSVPTPSAQPDSSPCVGADSEAFLRVYHTREPLDLLLDQTGQAVIRAVLLPIGRGTRVTGFLLVGLGSCPGLEERRRGLLECVARLSAPPTDGVTGVADAGREHLLSPLERAQAPQAVRDDDESLRLVVESAKDYAIFTMAVDGRIQSWNTGAERMFGWTEAEALGQHARMIFTPEDRAVRAAEQEMRQAEQFGRAEDERWHLRRDGRRFYASGVLVPLQRDGMLTGYAKIARDLTERKQFEEALQRAHDDLEDRVRERTSELARMNSELAAEVQERRAAEAQVKALFKRLVTVQEEERRRIARDLHDQLGQPLTALRLNLDALEGRDVDPASFADRAARTRALAEELDQSIDFLTWDLRPSALDDLGLVTALAQLVNSWSERFNVPADFASSWPDQFRLAAEAEANLYRLTQEALHNIIKHSGARHASVLLEYRGDRAVLIVEDDGRGFIVSDVLAHTGDKGLGLVSMRERATLVGGELHIEAAPGQGTSIFVYIPVTHQEKRASLLPRDDGDHH